MEPVARNYTDAYDNYRNQNGRKGNNMYNGNTMGEVSLGSVVQNNGIVQNQVNGRNMNAPQMRQNGTPIPPSNVQNSQTGEGQNSQVQTAPYEREIAQLFIQFGADDSVFLIMSKRHPNVNWNKQLTKSTIERLIKIGLKKVMKFRKDHYNVQPPIPALNLN